MKQLTRAILALLAFLTSVSAAPVIRTSAGSTPAAIQTQINAFFSDLGGVDNGTGNSYTTGRRELDFGLVPDSLAEPNLFPGDFFRTNVPRGAMLTSKLQVQRPRCKRRCGESDQYTGCLCQH